VAGTIPVLAERRTTMSALSLDRAIELHHKAGDRIMRGDYEGYADLYSREEDVTLGNPFGPFARGHENVLRALQGAAANYRDGEATGVERISEHVTDDLACFVEVEHYRAKVGGRRDVTPVSARATSVFRMEQDGWRLVHRHADPITDTRPAESVIER
jgi:ketosteroid isomerase-like protein